MGGNKSKKREELLKLRYLEILYYLCQQIKSFDEKIEEASKSESELLYLIQENRILINLFRGESQISIIHPDFKLLNCKTIKFFDINRNTYHINII